MPAKKLTFLVDGVQRICSSVAQRATQKTTHVANQEAQIEKQLQDAWVKQATIYVVLMYKVQVRSCKNKLLLGVFAP